MGYYYTTALQTRLLHYKNNLASLKLNIYNIKKLSQVIWLDKDHNFCVLVLGEYLATRLPRRQLYVQSESLGPSPKKIASQ